MIGFAPDRKASELTSRIKFGFVWLCFLPAKSSNFTYLLVIKELKPIFNVSKIGFVLGLNWVCIGFDPRQKSK